MRYEIVEDLDRGGRKQAQFYARKAAHQLYILELCHLIHLVLNRRYGPDNLQYGKWVQHISEDGTSYRFDDVSRIRLRANLRRALHSSEKLLISEKYTQNGVGLKKDTDHEIE